MSPTRSAAALVLLAAVARLSPAQAAQSPPAIRPIGPVERFTTDSLSSVAAALPMADGRVLVNDITARRLVLFDSTLARPAVVADTTSATANAYGDRPGQLIHFRGDSALFIDAGPLSMFVIGPFKMIPDAVPVVDDWVVRADGTIAIVRGRDFHIDWIGADGHMTSTGKVPFDWHRLSDDEKRARIDSALAPIQRNVDMILERRARILAGGSAGGGGAGRSGTGSRGGSSSAGGTPPARRTGPTAMIPIVPTAQELSELPDYAPAFELSSTRADGEGNLWIRTTALAGSQPIYDIVNARGDLVDRVTLPPYRAIAGFGPGVVYLGVTDPAGAVHLERARVK